MEFNGIKLLVRELQRKTSGANSAKWNNKNKRKMLNCWRYGPKIKMLPSEQHVACTFWMSSQRNSHSQMKTMDFKLIHFNYAGCALARAPSAFRNSLFRQRKTRARNGEGKMQRELSRPIYALFLRKALHFIRRTPVTPLIFRRFSVVFAFVATARSHCPLSSSYNLAQLHATSATLPDTHTATAAGRLRKRRAGLNRLGKSWTFVLYLHSLTLSDENHSV